MHYDPESLRSILENYQRIEENHHQLLKQLAHLCSRLKKINSKVYLTEGAGRRINLLVRCIKNIFRIFPPQRNEKLPSDDLEDLAINLHAFFVNTSGLFDNLGWVFVFEHDLFGKYKEGKLGRRDIGLFNAKTQVFLPQYFLEYLQSEDLQSWHLNYQQNYRDALAHRIPLYVPPSILNEKEGVKYQELIKKMQTQLKTLYLADMEQLNRFNDLLQESTQLGRTSPIFAHSLNEGGKPVSFHSQVIVDYLTIEELTIKFCETFPDSIPNNNL